MCSRNTSCSSVIIPAIVPRSCGSDWNLTILVITIVGVSLRGHSPASLKGGVSLHTVSSILLRLTPEVQSSTFRLQFLGAGKLKIEIYTSSTAPVAPMLHRL